MILKAGQKAITFLVSPNGLGHFRRVLLVVEQLVDIRANRSITVYCSKEQFNKRHYWNLPNVLDSKDIQWELLEFPPSTYWSSKLSGFNAQDHIKFFKNLIQLPAIRNADLVISDNLAGILACRQDAYLMGSFLWCDVFSPVNANKVNREILKIVDWERKLLLRSRPQMFCLQDMMMPALEELTRPVPLAWFCSSDRSTTPGEVFRILVTGGNTKVLNEKIIAALACLPKNPDWQILIDKNLAKAAQQLPNLDFSEFSFETKDFQSLSMIVARPGIGILTEAVRFCIPVLAIMEAENKEILHNSQRVLDLGIGHTIGEEELSHLPYHISESFSPSKITTYQSRLSQLQLNGHLTVKDHLLHFLETKQSSLHYE